MKLEDIKLQLGDKITFDDDTVKYISSNDLAFLGISPEKISSSDEIVKIERLKQVTTGLHLTSKGSVPVYILETIWERKEILDNKEKEYLSNVIRPFRDNVRYVQKSCIYHKQSEFIFIKMKNDVVMNFPLFKMRTMYKNMETSKEYSLNDLGL